MECDIGGTHGAEDSEPTLDLKHGNAKKGRVRLQWVKDIVAHDKKINAELNWGRALNANDLAAALLACGDGRHDQHVFSKNMYYLGVVPTDTFGLGAAVNITAMQILAGLGKMDWLLAFAMRGALDYSGSHALAYIFAKACSCACRGQDAEDACRLVELMLHGCKADPLLSLKWIPANGGFKAFDQAEVVGGARAMHELDALGAMAIHANAAMMEKIMDWIAMDMANEHPNDERLEARKRFESINKAKFILKRLNANGSKQKETEQCLVALDRYMAMLKPKEPTGAAEGIEEMPTEPSSKQLRLLREEIRKDFREEIEFLREGQILMAQAVAELKRPEKTAGLREWLGRAMKSRKGGACESN